MKDSLRPSHSELLCTVKKTLLLLLAMLSPLSADPLKPYLWKNRIILIHSEETSDELKKQKDELADRDLIILRLSSSGKALPNEVSLTEKEREELRARYKVADDDPATFILLGKDGGEKARQTKKLDLEKFFALIDTMPMRRSEMKK